METLKVLRRLHPLVLALGNRTYLPTWIALLVVVLSFVFAENQNRIIHDQRSRADVQSEAGLIRSRLEGYLNADIQLVKGLVAVIASQPDITQERFSALAAETIGNKSEILNIAVAPDLVVTMVHPLEPNRAVIGLDYNQNAGAACDGVAGTVQRRCCAGRAGGPRPRWHRLYRAVSDFHWRRGRPALLGAGVRGD